MEEYELKRQIAKRTPGAGLSRKDLQKVDQHMHALLIQHEQAVLSVESGDAPSTGLQGTATTQLFSQPVTDAVRPVGDLRQNVLSAVSSSAEAFKRWKVTAKVSDSASVRPAAAPTSRFTRPEVAPLPKMTARPSRGRTQQQRPSSAVRPPSQARPSSASRPSSARSAAPRGAKMPKMPRAPSARGGGGATPRSVHFARMGRLQGNVLRSVGHIAATNPSNQLGPLRQHVVALRSEFSSLSNARRQRSTAAKELITLLASLSGTHAVGAAKCSGLASKLDSLQIKLQAVNLKFAEETENCEVAQISITQLHEENSERQQ